MAWFGLGKEIAKPIEAVSKLYTTDQAKLEGQQKLEETLQKPQIAQLENNRIAMLSKSFFESAWQPLVGWTAGACVALYYVPQLIIANYIWATNSLHNHVVYPFPIAPDDILNLVYLLFGFGTYHLAKKKFLG